MVPVQMIINKVDRKSIFKVPRGTFGKLNLFFSEKGHVTTILCFVYHMVKYIAGKKYEIISTCCMDVRSYCPIKYYL